MVTLRLPLTVYYSFRVKRFTLGRQIRSVRRPCDSIKAYDSPPIVSAPPHVKLMRITFQNMLKSWEDVTGCCCLILFVGTQHYHHHRVIMGTAKITPILNFPLGISSALTHQECQTMPSLDNTRLFQGIFYNTVKIRRQLV